MVRQKFPMCRIIYQEHILTELVFRRPVTYYERFRGGNNSTFATREGDIRTSLVSYKDDMSSVPNVCGVKANYILGRKLNLGVHAGNIDCQLQLKRQSF